MDSKENDYRTTNNYWFTAACHFCNPYVPFLAVTAFERFICSDLWEGGS